MKGLLVILLHLRENLYRYLNVFFPLVWSHCLSQVQILINLIIIAVANFEFRLEDHRYYMTIDFMRR